MIIFNSAEKLKNHLNELRSNGKTIGFAPTMGALHQGHISLIAIAKGQCDVVVCSIFVNPTQFNDLKDLEKYPRTLDTDTALLQSANCDILFAPEVNEIYAAEELKLKKENKEDKSWMLGKAVDFGMMDKVMEGALRPGHFNGVAQVVSKLFRIVNPHKAFFGQKDFQQLSIIRSMVKQLELPIEIIACPIVRESDGLAMSSRNIRITPEERELVPYIWKTLVAVSAIYMYSTIDNIKKLVTGAFEETGIIQLEYFEIVDADTLQTIVDFKNAASAVACVAVKLKNVRLIDNIVLY
jgi:pantoate--beta-alanine ligase